MRSDEEPRPIVRWLRAAMYAVVTTLLAPVALVLFVVQVVAIPLVLVSVGALVLWVKVPITGAFCDLHRRMAAGVLDRPWQPGDYRPTNNRGIFHLLSVWSTDSLRWRDLGWLVIASTVGFVISLVGVIFTATLILLPFVEPLMKTRAVMDLWALGRSRNEVLEARVHEVTESRAATVDSAAAELRRVERDLHDGAQARLAALGMTIGLAESQIATDPEGARQLMAEARASATSALGDLRSVVRGIHPPVLADRGVGPAVEALALDMPLPITLNLGVHERLPVATENAVYFAVAEALANIGKHARARNAWIAMGIFDGVLRVEVGDDGVGGAAPSGSGLHGVTQRLTALDGRLFVHSPIGGPTIVSMEVPCAS
ncbi:histidine kinase [Williamsia sp. DF01-3]|uniref:sensor histidine kinase n=1 Tax=Williamsia sp. DF01-3 TaxID=2934157 RepID=UPI001FF424A0|nr:histidine kinase [Williamsia sp. DF01-3]MCK0516371.1 histidine kinase [Williamsia sp. DF01-3]